MEKIFIWLSENWLNQITCTLEIILILICIHGVFKEKFKLSVNAIMLTILELIVLALINTSLLPAVCSFITYILMFIYCKQIFKRKILETIRKFVLSFLAVGLIEIVASIISTPFTKIFSDESAKMFQYNVVGIFISVIIFNLPKIKKGQKIKLDKEKWGMLVVTSGLYLVVMLVDYRIRGEVDQLYYFLFFLSCVIVCFATVENQKARHELEKKKLENEIQKVYDSTYRELILEVRKRQHDFKNQLTAIYSMHLNATSLEELVEQQKQYGDVLIHRSRYDSMLFGCENSVLVGYLYYRFITLEEENIQIDYRINVESASCRLPLYEIIEILGILTTNAAEYYVDYIGEKIVKIRLQETIRNLYIEVSNKASKYNVSEIERMFSAGYSSKGEKRGLGLPRLKELAEKADADIVVDNRQEGENNWILFSITIPKSEGE